jgi:hypothetical protein
MPQPSCGRLLSLTGFPVNDDLVLSVSRVLDNVRMMVWVTMAVPMNMEVVPVVGVVFVPMVMSVSSPPAANLFGELDEFEDVLLRCVSTHSLGTYQESGWDLHI